jgi:hypothetical protein
MEEKLIAPCGMNCSLCVSYQSQKYDLKKQGFNRKYCPGCIPRGENCTHMGDQCEPLKNGTIRFCYQCETFPCKRLKALDKRYRTKYHLSMIENLKSIEKNGMDSFLISEAEKWACSQCGKPICCHNGLCLKCDLEILRQNKKYRWNEE